MQRAVNTMQAIGINYKVIQIELLDDSDLSRNIFKKTKTKEILENVFQIIDIIEKEYFGLYFKNLQTDERVWLKPSETVWSQIVKAMEPPYQLYFGVKYFPFDPLSLQEDVTLYMMYLQLRRDIKDGRCICSDHERAEMLAHILQAEAGKWFVYQNNFGFPKIHKPSRLGFPLILLFSFRNTKQVKTIVM